LSAIVTFRGHQIGDVCVFIRSSHSNMLVLSTFIMDFVLLAFMLAGVLRWHDSRRKGGTWWLLTSQVGLHHLVDNAWSFDLISHADIRA